MGFMDICRAGVDFWHKNDYELNEYVIHDGKQHPFAIVCPGGGYQMVSYYNEGRPFALELNLRGYSAFVLRYRCKSKARFPAPQEDLARGLREILDRAEELGVDVNGYSIWGSSAGGHLAASFGTQEMGYAHYGLPKPAALVLEYPVITMGDLAHQGSRKNLLGRHPTQDMIDLTSVERHITADYPPTYVWYGDADNVVDIENSRMLARALTSHQVPCKLRMYPGVGHGIGLGTGLACEGWFDEGISFWEQHRQV